MSNCRAREFDGSLGPGSSRKIFVKINLCDKLRAWRRAGAKNGDLAWAGGVSTCPERCLGTASIANLAQSIRHDRLAADRYGTAAAPFAIFASVVDGLVSDNDEFVLSRSDPAPLLIRHDADEDPTEPRCVFARLGLLPLVDRLVRL
jgi:hypothetical protein